MNEFIAGWLPEGDVDPEQHVRALIAAGESERLESSLRWDHREERVNKALEGVAVKARAGFQAAWGPDPLQGVLFPDHEDHGATAVRERRPRYGQGAADGSSASAQGATTLDRVHTAMLLQAGGQANALRALLRAEQERGRDFLRLANALSALYPRGSHEKRLLDAMLLAAPR